MTAINALTLASLLLAAALLPATRAAADPAEPPEPDAPDLDRRIVIDTPQLTVRGRLTAKLGTGSDTQVTIAAPDGDGIRILTRDGAVITIAGKDLSEEDHRRLSELLNSTDSMTIELTDAVANALAGAHAALDSIERHARELEPEMRGALTDLQIMVAPMVSDLNEVVSDALEGLDEDVWAEVRTALQEARQSLHESREERRHALEEARRALEEARAKRFEELAQDRDADDHKAFDFHFDWQDRRDEGLAEARRELEALRDRRREMEMLREELEHRDRAQSEAIESLSEELRAARRELERARRELERERERAEKARQRAKEREEARDDDTRKP